MQDRRTAVNSGYIVTLVGILGSSAANDRVFCMAERWPDGQIGKLSFVIGGLNTKR